MTKRKVTRKHVVRVHTYNDEFGGDHSQILEEVELHGATLRQLDNDNYLQSAFLLSVPSGKYEDGSKKYREWVLQGCKLFLTRYGFHIKGFMPQFHKSAERPIGPYRRARVWGPVKAIR